MSTGISYVIITSTHVWYGRLTRDVVLVLLMMVVVVMVLQLKHEAESFRFLCFQHRHIINQQVSLELLSHHQNSWSILTINTGFNVLGIRLGSV